MSGFAFYVMKAFKSQTKTLSAMKYAAKIEVSLKPGHSNPEGETQPTSSKN
jgi:hypothetical protein